MAAAALVADYTSDSDGAEAGPAGRNDDAAAGPAGAQHLKRGLPATYSSDDDSDCDSDGVLSEDALREREEKRRRQDAPAELLPSVADAFAAVSGPPQFLSPEATRQLPTGPARAVQQPSHVAQRAAVARRTVPAAAVVASAPVRAKTALELHEEVHGSGGGRLAAAMHRAESRDRADTREEARGGGGGGRAGRGPAGGRTKAMGVSDFLDKGAGGAVLPRKKQDRSAKEKSKRELGQSAIGTWKSEAEMVLRQQYD